MFTRSWSDYALRAVTSDGVDTVGSSTPTHLPFLIGKVQVSGVAAFQPREQLRYNGVRKVRKVRAVRMEEMPFYLRKITKCRKTKQKLWGL